MSIETGVSLPITEQDNPRSANLSSQSAAEIVALMNAEDATVAASVQQVLGDVTAAVEAIVERLKKGGRLFYIGTGTSGRLGVLDASECAPTFGVRSEEHTSELQSQSNLVCRLLLEKKKINRCQHDLHTQYKTTD